MPATFPESKAPGCHHLLLGLTGCIACAEMPRYVRLLREAWAENLDVILTPSAARFLRPELLAAYARTTVYVDPFDFAAETPASHIELGRRADLVLVMPASANTLAKTALGIADNLLVTTLLATTAPIVFVPSMNPVMWQKKVVQNNVALLRELGHTVIDPAQGLEIASLLPGLGGMPPFGSLLTELQRVLAAWRERPG